MSNLELYHKLIVLDIVSKKISASKHLLLKELLTQANNPVIVKRRFRMLAQLSSYESQIYSKTYQFKTDNLDEYFYSLDNIIREIDYVTDRNA